MTARVASIVVALAGVAGCVSYRGSARATDPARLTAERGWIVAAPTPALRQRGSHDCGAASLAMIAGRWQVPLSVAGAAAALPATTPQGIRLGNLRDAARAQGLLAFAIAGDHATLLHELRAGRPVIVGLVLPYGSGRAKSHYEVVVALHPAAGKVVTIDPATGWVARRWADFDAAWRPGGRPSLVVLGPTPKRAMSAPPTRPRWSERTTDKAEEAVGHTVKDVNKKFASATRPPRQGPSEPSERLARGCWL